MFNHSSGNFAPEQSVHLFKLQAWHLSLYISYIPPLVENPITLYLQSSVLRSQSMKHFSTRTLARVSIHCR